MGNQHSGNHYHHHHHPHKQRHPSMSMAEEPLDSIRREKERDEKLKNLDFKRSRSIRKSIAKRLGKSSKKRPSLKDETDHPQPELNQEPAAGKTLSQPATGEVRDAAATKSATVPEAPKSSEPTVQVMPLITAPATSTAKPKQKPLSETPIQVSKPQPGPGSGTASKPLVGEPQPMPSHVQNTNVRRMDKLRRSLRSSVRRNKDRQQQQQSGISDNIVPNSKSLSQGKPYQWQLDETAVRSGLCSFPVKYLGSIEVFDSRGMQVCEEALKVLKNSKRKSVRSILHVSGDGLKVVDEDTKGLILDQTIEKVSFCAPDRNFERGFSYICRDGTTRRWMCHGFIACKESGERLSHAVGCAFAICLERKQKRDRECAVSMNYDTSNSSFTRLGSFRQASITERLQDPQVLKPGPEEPPKESDVINPYAIARPHATDLMLIRQTSFRGFNQLQSNSPFKRNLSLRLAELPSTLERQRISNFISQNGAVPEEESPKVEEDPAENTFDKLSSGLGSGTSFSSPSATIDSLQDIDPSTAARTTQQPSSIQPQHTFRIIDNNNRSILDSMPKPLQPIQHVHHHHHHHQRPPTMNASLLAPVPENATLSGSEATSSHSIPVSWEASKGKGSFQRQNAAASSSTTKGSLTSSSSPTSSSSSSSSSDSSAPPVKSRPKMSEVLSNVKPVVYDNPWDLVPDQPSLQLASSASTSAATKGQNNLLGLSQQQQHVNCDSSSGVSSSSMSSQNGTTLGSRPGGERSDHVVEENGEAEQHLAPGQAWLEGVMADSVKMAAVSKASSPTPRTDQQMDDDRPHQEWGGEAAASVLDDPFDAEWAALATRSISSSLDGQPGAEIVDVSGKVPNKNGLLVNNNNTNPFYSEEAAAVPAALSSSSSMKKTFEIHM